MGLPIVLNGIVLMVLAQSDFSVLSTLDKIMLFLGFVLSYLGLFVMINKSKEV